MTRSVQLFIPRKHEAALLEKLEDDPLVRRLNVFECRRGHQVQISFLCVDKHLSSILVGLEETGLGTEFGSIDIMSLQSTIPSLAQPKLKGYTRQYNIMDRRTIREIEATVDGDSRLTFDYLLLIGVASTIAAVGLISDSAVVVVASMLVSPLMNPIVCVAFGLAIGKWELVGRGLRNELWGLLLCVCVGAVCGAVAVMFYAPLGFEFLVLVTGSVELHSEEMESRGKLIGLVTGFWSALPSGIGVALATTNARMTTLVGVAISSSLLPPIVNAAMMLTMGLTYYSEGVEVNGRDLHYLWAGATSFLLFLLNLFTIVFAAVLTFWLKGVNGKRMEFRPRTPSILKLPQRMRRAFTARQPPVDIVCPVNAQPFPSIPSP